MAGDRPGGHLRRFGANLEALASGRIRVARVDPSRRPAAWPGEPAATVVLDVSARQRDTLHAWVRRHHGGSLVVLLKPGERVPALAFGPASVVVGRPFRLAKLVRVLEDPPAPLPEPAPPGPATPRPAPGARDLLRASAEQRRRRLGSLAGAGAGGQPSRPAAGARAPAAAEWGLPRPDWPTAATRLDGRRRRARHGRRLAARVGAGVLVLLVLAGAWLALGLFEARRDLLVAAAAVRAELTAAEAALERGRPAEAAAAVQAAERSLAVAAAVPDRRELRVAAGLPLLSPGVRDTRHLLAAAARLTGAGERAVAVAAHLRPGRAPLLDGGRFDLGALDDATAQATGLVAELEAARAELGQVRGGPLPPGADQTRRWALGRVEEAAARARPLLAAAGSGGRTRPDGVVALDPTAVRALLEATGPVAVPGYGRLDAAGAVGQLTSDAEARWPDPAQRRRYQQAALGAVAERFLAGRDLVAVGRALGAAGAGGHLAAYAADPGLERLLARQRLDGGRG